MAIDVYFESINQTITEWLVNFEYLKIKATEYNLELKSLESFRDTFKTLPTDNPYGQANNMSQELKDYSFMNKTFVFQKI